MKNPSPQARNDSKQAPRSWKAAWIWPRDRREPNLHLLFRRDFEVKDPVDSAVMFIAAESAAQIFLNGREIGRTAANSYPNQHYYEEFDCRPALVKGKNRLAILARYIGIPSSASIPKDPGVLCELVFCGKGVNGSLGSDATWKCKPMEAWLGRQRRSEWLNLDQVEIVDRRLLPVGFPFPEDLSGFEEPESLAWPGVRFPGLEPRPFPKASACGDARMTVLKAGTVVDQSASHPIPAMAVSSEPIEPCDFGWDGSNGFSIPVQPAGRAFALLLEFDQYVSGRPELVVSGPAGTVVDIAWQEKLVNGQFDVRDTRVYTADRFILAAGENRIVQEDWTTGRLLQLTFRKVTAPLQVHQLRFEREEYPLQQRMVFKSSDARLERIFEISLQAVRRCMHDNIMDCPWRERRQWPGDVQRIALINHFAFGDRALVRGVLRQHVQLQDPSGRMWVCSPIWEEFPTQSMEWLRAVLEYGQYTGDETLLGEVFDNADLLHRWFLRNRDNRGLLFLSTRPLNNWMDNPFKAIWKWQFELPLLGVNLRYLHFLDDMAECFQRMGHTGDAERAGQERKRLAGAIREHFTHADTGLLCDYPEAGPSGPPRTFSEMGHALAVCTGLLPSKEAGALWDRFVEFRKERPKDVIPVSPFGKYHTHQALALLGRRDELMADILAGWGPMVDKGAATTWESFGGGESHCHGWAGIPVLALAGLLGLDPRKPGKARKEKIGGVEWIEGEIRTGFRAYPV